MLRARARVCVCVVWCVRGVYVVVICVLCYMKASTGHSGTTDPIFQQQQNPPYTLPVSGIVLCRPYLRLALLLLLRLQAAPGAVLHLLQRTNDARGGRCVSVRAGIRVCGSVYVCVGEHTTGRSVLVLRNRKGGCRLFTEIDEA